jgi:hypothetical protein
MHAPEPQIPERNAFAFRRQREAAHASEPQIPERNAFAFRRQREAAHASEPQIPERNAFAFRPAREAAPLRARPHSALAASTSRSFTPRSARVKGF